MYKEDLALNNLQRLMCHKTQPINHLVLTNVAIYIHGGGVRAIEEEFASTIVSHFIGQWEPNPNYPNAF